MMEEPSLTDKVPEGLVAESLKCPECGSERLYRAGLRYREYGNTVQRWLCRVCGFRFSQPSEKGPLRKKPYGYINNACLSTSSRQVCELDGSLRNLAISGTRQEEAQREGTTSTADVKGKLIEFAWYLKKNAKNPSTIQVYGVWLNTLLKHGADLTDPESVKETIALQEQWTSTTKSNVVAAYNAFAAFLGIVWKPPKYTAEQRMPFIPLESELDTLIAASGKKMAALLQVLKETGMRSGEAWRLLWTDVDMERLVVSVNKPEKKSNPRVIKISPKLAGMLGALPRTSQKVFATGNLMSWRQNFRKARKRVAAKLQNPRLAQITFHTFRHWKGTMEYHRTKDPYYVKQLLGHKSIRNTETYINIEHAIFQSETDEFNAKVAETPEEIKTLLEVGFEYICEKDGLMFFRKRK